MSERKLSCHFAETDPAISESIIQIAVKNINGESNSQREEIIREAILKIAGVVCVDPFRMEF